MSGGGACSSSHKLGHPRLSAGPSDGAQGTFGLPSQDSNPLNPTGWQGPLYILSTVPNGWLELFDWVLLEFDESIMG